VRVRVLAAVLGVLRPVPGREGRVCPAAAGVGPVPAAPVTDCAAPRHDGQNEPTPAEPAARLCKPCRLDLAADLRRLPHLDHHLSILTIAAQNAAGNGTPRLPFDADISEWRSWFRRNTTRATSELADERHWDLPEDHPYAMCAWLRPQVRWISYREWAPWFAGTFRKIRSRGEQLAAPLKVKHVYLPGACLDCGNGRMQAIIYADHHAGRWSYWVCPACRTVTQIEFWWDYPKRLAARAG
jgi:hypothetical protein